MLFSRSVLLTYVNLIGIPSQWSDPCNSNSTLIPIYRILLFYLLADGRTKTHTDTLGLMILEVFPPTKCSRLRDQ